MANPIFREFYSERDVVHEERRLRYENTAGGRAYEAMNSLLFSAHPYGNPVIGWPGDIQRLERQDAIDYFASAEPAGLHDRTAVQEALRESSAIADDKVTAIEQSETLSGSEKRRRTTRWRELQTRLQAALTRVGS